MRGATTCSYCGWYLGGKPAHDCPAFRREQALPHIALTVIPPRSDEDVAESLRRYRRGLLWK